jgi:hypothetical protein
VAALHDMKPAYPDTRSEAYVIGYNKAYNFITLNMGSKDGLKKNVTVAVVRDGKLVAKARIKQLRESVAAATVLPGTLRSDIQAGDQITIA